MIRSSKLADERRAAGSTECWLLHGAVGAASDWRGFAGLLEMRGLGSRAVDLWRFLDGGSLSMTGFAAALNREVTEEGGGILRRVLVGYSMGARLALHALLENPNPWDAAVLVSAHGGLESEGERADRRAADARWASRAFAGSWTDFIAEWNKQDVLGGGAIRDARADEALASRRGEIARSFIDWSLGTQAPLWGRLAEIGIPVFWVAGEDDSKFCDLAVCAAECLPGSRFRIAPKCGHRVPWQAGSWLAEEIAGFLGTADGG